MSIRTVASSHLLQSFVGIVLATFASSVLSIPITWNFSNVTFNDGGMASGMFNYDAATNTFSNIAITTTPGAVRPGTTYTMSSGVGTAVNPDFLEPPLPVVPGQTERLSLFLAQPMTDAGGTIALTAISELTCIDFGCSFVTGTEPGLNLRFALPANAFITTAVEPPSVLPEPASLTLLGLGLLIFAVWRRRRTRRNGRR